MLDGIIYNRFNFIINNVGYTNSNMEKLYSIIHKSALETYDLLDKNKKPIIQLISMSLPKETRDFIFNKDFDYDKYYSKSELEAMNAKKLGKSSKKKRKGKKSDKQSISLSKSINKSKLRCILYHIPENLLNFLIFFSYLSLHSIYFWSILIILLFVSNIHYLLIVLFVIIINTFATILFSGCPINIIERKYRHKLTPNQHFLCNIIKKLQDNYIYYTYEQHIEQLLFGIFLLIIKINLLILYNCFCKFSHLNKR
jgi:hypothetical protein